MAIGLSNGEYYEDEFSARVHSRPITPSYEDPDAPVQMAGIFRKDVQSDVVPMVAKPQPYVPTPQERLEGSFYAVRQQEKETLKNLSEQTFRRNSVGSILSEGFSGAEAVDAVEETAKSDEPMEMGRLDDAMSFDDMFAFLDSTDTDFSASGRRFTPYDPNQAPKVIDPRKEPAANIGGAGRPVLTRISKPDAPRQQFSFPTRTSAGGKLIIEPTNGGKNLHIEWIGSQGNSYDFKTGVNQLGISTVKQMVQELRQMFPKAETLSGHRVSGARYKSHEMGGKVNPDAFMRIRRGEKQEFDDFKIKDDSE